MKKTDKWNERYAQSDHLFGIAPNEFMLTQANLIKPGMNALSIADGEAFNSLWLANRGLSVTSIDISQAAQNKARANPAFEDTDIAFICDDALNYATDDSSYDLITVFFLHIPSQQRNVLHNKILSWLKPGGILLYECFHKDQALTDWGPDNTDLLINEEDMQNSFSKLVTLGVKRIASISYEESRDGSGEKNSIVSLQYVAICRPQEIETR